MHDPLATLRARRAEIARTIKDLSAEDRELATAELVLQRIASAPGQASRRSPGSARQGENNDRRRPRSQREYVIETLATSSKAWLRTNEIVTLVKKRWGEEIPELSLRPLLTQLKKSGAIVRTGRVVALEERASEPLPGQGPRRR